MLLGFCLVAPFIVSTVIVLAAVRFSDEPECADVMHCSTCAGCEPQPLQLEPAALQ